MSDVEFTKSNPKHSKDYKPLIVLINEFFNKDEMLKDLLSYNEIFQSINFNRPFMGARSGMEIDDALEDEILLYISERMGKEISKIKLTSVINTQARKIIKNPIKEYLEKLPEWDRIPRLPSWLATYCNAAGNAYTAMVGSLFFQAAVARIYEPGVKYDYLMILEGESRIGKSRILQAIGGEWYLDMHLEDTNKDIIDNMRGKWIIEISELSGFRKKETDWLKAFLSRGTDRVRLSYGRRSKDYPRQSVLAGTTNPSGDNDYLKDDTGNARYLPITCIGTIKVDEMRMDRDKLFAEALYNYKKYEIGKNGEGLYPTGNALKIAEKEQSDRQSFDPWTSKVISLLPQYNEISSNELLDRMGISIERQTHYEQVRVGKIMKALGWTKKQNPNGTRTYIREGVIINGEHEQVEKFEE